MAEVTDHIKTILTQRVYAALGEAGVTDRQKALRVLAVVNAAVDESYSRFARPFDKAIDDLVVAAQEAVSSKNSKSG